MTGDDAADAAEGPYPETLRRSNGRTRHEVVEGPARRSFHPTRRARQ